MQTSLRIFALTSCILSGAVAQGCKTLPLPSLPLSNQKEEEAAQTPMQVTEMQLPMGTIHHVDPEAGFVLIRTSRITDITPDTRVTVYGNCGVVSAILNTGEARKGQFVTADIVEGMPVRGDQCTMIYTPPQPGAGPGQDPGGDEVQVLE